jgi:hypothetical protein
MTILSALPRRSWMVTGYTLVVLAWVAYALLSFYSPANIESTYHISTLERVLLQTSVALPILLIWLIAIRGAMTFKRYANLLVKDVEAPAMNWIANGLLWLVVYIILLAMVGVLPAYYAHSSQLGTVIETKNHLPLLAALTGFVWLFLGSRRLHQVTSFSVQTPRTRWLLIGLSGAAALFAVTFLSTYDAVTHLPSQIPTYTFSPTVLLFTLVLPYIAAWLLGLLASLNIHYYAQKVSGTLYRQALRDLVHGIIGVTAFISFLQLLLLMAPAIVSLGLGSFLLLLYSLLVLYGAGFWLVSQGAQRLARIEVIP